MRLRILAVLTAILINSVSADPPPSRPDYIASLPRDEWVFAQALWKGREPCTADVCEAGFHSKSILLSLRVSKSSDPINNAIMAVAGIEGCDAVSWNLMWEKDYSNLSAARQFAYVSERVRSLAASAAKGCGDQSDVVVPVEPPKRFFAK